MRSYSVSLITDSTTFITSVDSDKEDIEDYDLALLAVSRILDEEGIDLTHRRWDIMVEEI
ncbi:hypothetical protein UFOVP325_35 [uncultured Caudovirales phage]|jgi:hypothetical protein|uniref:Uncharacterized protein n=1 Tax=uncultured Caudovirales phage TaxID=2100421 RepID=A0A6J5LT83_9CAUD|nr:hypothetical protein UFOVP325_35 [uncultured Caudovirales phage]CAB4147497.1 hypothetical protein UFOVP430_30 [uncultured Caudovirales phage]